MIIITKIETKINIQINFTNLKNTQHTINNPQQQLKEINYITIN